MINIFNRKEVFTTLSTEDYAKAIAKLNSKNVKYVTKVINLCNSSSGWVGNNSIRQDFSREYIIYVKKSDEEIASYCIATRNDLK